MSTFQQRQEKKAAYFKEQADKNKRLADERIDRARGELDRVPMGQPILVGHHSEKSHRALLKRVDSHYRKSSEHLKKAEHYERRSEVLQNSNVIFIDDPEAETKLENKIAAYEKLQEAYKQFNKTCRKHGVKTAIEQWPGDKSRVQSIVDMYFVKYNHETQQREFHDKGKLPGFLLTNLNARLKRYKSKLNVVQSVKEESQGERIVLFEEGTTRAVIEEMRVNVYFDSVPDAELRTKLKSWPLSLKWSPMMKCWTRKCSANTENGYFKETLQNVLRGTQHKV